MSDKQLIFDREGRVYEVNADEAESLLASGAYFTENTAPIGEADMPKTSSNLVTIYDVKTGQSIDRRPVDARELVKSGHYAYKNPNDMRYVQSAPDSGQNAAPNKQAAETDDFPVLSESATKQEIMTTLSQYGIQYRSTMDKADLLALWADFLLEHQAGK